MPKITKQTLITTVVEEESSLEGTPQSVQEQSKNFESFAYPSEIMSLAPFAVNDVFNDAAENNQV